MNRYEDLCESCSPYKETLIRGPPAILRKYSLFTNSESAGKKGCVSIKCEDVGKTMSVPKHCDMQVQRKINDELHIFVTLALVRGV
jgi:hypothetical protein